MGDKNIYSSLKKIPVDESWFEVYEVKNGVFAIYEPYHFQEVISYLIIGSKKTLLLDTGMGIGNIKKVVRYFTNNPVVVINSHIHFDHIGNNYMFDKVYVFNRKEALDRLSRGYSVSELKPHTSKKLFEREAPNDFDYGNYFIPPCNPIPINDGDIIDLGDRVIEIIHTPGHSFESIMLLDRKNRMLFTGDSYYPGHLYAHFDGGIYGKSDIPIYASSMRKICNLIPLLDTIHPSHNDPIGNPLILVKVADALQSLSEGNVTCGRWLHGDLSVASLPDSGEAVEGYVIPDDLYVYDFDGFSIIASKHHK